MNAKIVKLVVSVKLQPIISIISQKNVSYVHNLILTVSSAVVYTIVVNAEEKDSTLLEVCAKIVQ